MATNIPIPPSQQGGSPADQQIVPVLAAGVQQQSSLATCGMPKVQHDTSTAPGNYGIQGFGQGMPVHVPLSTPMSQLQNIPPSQHDNKQGFIPSSSQVGQLQGVHVQHPVASFPVDVQAVSSAGANLQSSAIVSSYPQNIQQVGIQNPSQGQVMYQQQQQGPDHADTSYCRVVMYHSDGSRREFIVEETDGNQVSFFCANAHVSAPSTASSILHGGQQMFPHHWELADVRSDTSSSLTSGNRSGFSAGSTGARSQFTAPTTSR